jgi:hypothetical protein
MFSNQDCGISLSSNETNAGGCFPLDDHIYCKNCSMIRSRSSNLINQQQQQSQSFFKFNPPPMSNLNSSLTPRSTDL